MPRAPRTLPKAPGRAEVGLAGREAFLSTALPLVSLSGFPERCEGAALHWPEKDSRPQTHTTAEPRPGGLGNPELARLGQQRNTGGSRGTAGPAAPLLTCPAFQSLSPSALHLTQPAPGAGPTPTSRGASPPVPTGSATRSWAPEQPALFPHPKPPLPSLLKESFDCLSFMGLQTLSVSW